MNRSKELLPIGQGIRDRKDCKTLRIKKKFFDAILDGSKKSEYRSNTDFYKNLFKSKFNYIYLHYQGPTGLVCEVKSIRLIKKPKSFSESIILTTPKIFKLNLGPCREVC